MMEWPGALDPRVYQDRLLERSDRLAAAARDADWEGVMRALDDQPPIGGVNGWPLRERSWATPLHRAAEHGAPPEVVDELVARGALTTLRDARGRTAHDLAADHGHEALLSRLEPRVEDSETFERQSEHLSHLVQELGGPDVRSPLRAPTAVVVHEAKDLSFPVPGHHGGMSLRSDETDRIHVTTTSRMQPGSATYHVVTRNDLVLVDFGWDA